MDRWMERERDRDREREETHNYKLSGYRIKYNSFYHPLPRQGEIGRQDYIESINYDYCLAC